MATLLVHDARVTGRSPHGLADYTINVGGASSLQSMISDVVRYANAHSGTISHLYILAHGKYRNISATSQLQEQSENNVRLSFNTGGCGINICREDLTIANLPLLSDWRGKVSRITLFSCGIAAVNPQVRNASNQIRSVGNGQVSTRYDFVNGEYFCQEFANATGANVVASDLAQDYGRYQNPVERLFDMPGEIETPSLLAMEGNIRTFRPNR
jgi:hypothetical protein